MNNIPVPVRRLQMFKYKEKIGIYMYLKYSLCSAFQNIQHEVNLQ